VGAVNRKTSLEELAALVSQALERAGITATLSGGGAVSIYTENEYESHDLDFVSSERNTVLAKAIAPLGFLHEAGSREFNHPDTDFYVEFPPGPIAFGETVVPSRSTAVLATRFGPLRIVTPTHIVLDRLAAYAAWNEGQSLDQAVMVARRHHIDWGEVHEWAAREHLDPEFVERVRIGSAGD
jgi:hypothetical protein